MKHRNPGIDEALLLVDFTPQELAELSDKELTCLATLGLDEDLPLAEENDQLPPDQWKEQFILFIQIYQEIKEAHYKRNM